MRSLKLVISIGVLSFATSAASQLRPSPLGDIYESYNDCFKVATKSGLQPSVLKGLGWSRATTTEGGKQVPSEPPIFGHLTRKPLIMLTADKGDGLCIVMARLESVKSFEEFTKAWGGKLPPPDKEGAISFKAEGHIVQLRRTGSTQEPSLSIAVVTPTESN